MKNVLSKIIVAYLICPSAYAIMPMGKKSINIQTLYENEPLVGGYTRGSSLFTVELPLG